MGYERRKQILHETIRGWVGYFKLADMKSAIEDIDKWLRRRIRMCIWKAWKHPKTRVKNLIKCGIKPYWAHMWGNASKGYWSVAGSPLVGSWKSDNGTSGLNPKPSHSRLSLPDGLLCSIAQNVRNRRMPNGTYGGVRGR